jgi:hypothetical protein
MFTITDARYNGNNVEVKLRFHENGELRSYIPCGLTSFPLDAIEGGLEELEQYVEDAKRWSGQAYVEGEKGNPNGFYSLSVELDADLSEPMEVSTRDGSVVTIHPVEAIYGGVSFSRPTIANAPKMLAARTAKPAVAQVRSGRARVAR